MTNGRFSCFVVGSGAVALHCTELLRLAGHQILGVYSFDAVLAGLEDTHGIPHAVDKKQFEENLHGQSYDYLFSINNPWIIPPSVLALASKNTINFHDSPLPKYAGLHATSWALIHGETSHATSWHEVVEDIDAGRILKQEAFVIAENDTAISLNVRVLELSVQSFKVLITELANGTAIAIEQENIVGSYFSLSDRPDAACIITLDDSAENLRNLVRGLDFGQTLNPLGLPKLLVDNKNSVLIFSGLQIKSREASAAVGTIIEVSVDGMLVSVADADVLLSGFISFEGEVQCIAQLQAMGCVAGARLPSLDVAEREDVSAFNRKACVNETFWRRLLSKCLPLEHPYCRNTGLALRGKSDEALISRVSLPIFQQERLSSDVDLILCLFSAYLVKAAGTEESLPGSNLQPCIGLMLNDVSALLQPFFSRIVPLAICSTDTVNESFSAFKDQFFIEIELCRKKGGITRDILLRDPSLRDKGLSSLSRITLAELDSPDELVVAALEAQVGLVCYRNGSAPELVHKGALQDWQASAIVAQITSVVRTCLSDPSVLIRNLPLLESCERDKILNTWNDTDTIFPETSTVDALISQQAQRSPDTIALKYENNTLSYAELDARSNQLARELRCQGVAEGDFVALCLPRSLDLIVGLIGIIKTGAAYVPIDPSYPEDRIQFLLEDSGASHILSNDNLYEQHFSRECARLISIDGDTTNIESQSVDPIERKLGPEGLLYIIYTSGSTGRPKGVMISHQGLVNHSWAMATKYQLNSEDCVLQSATISFDVAAEQIFPALFSGSRVVIRPEDLLESFQRFENFVSEETISTLILPTAYWHEWVADLVANQRCVPKSLRAIGVGTEKVLRNRLADWEKCLRGANVAFYQGYGPTETTITCTVYSHTSNGLANFNSDIPIGRPLANVKLYVLDSNLQPVPVGFEGELFVGGRGVALGYHQQAKLTAERFIPSPFSSDESNRLYRSGDLARWTPEGELIFIGRNDFQVKVRGIRVEIGEIEKSLEAMALVKHAVVHPKKDSAGNESLIAYVIAETNQNIDKQTADILTALGAKLPAFMVPDAVLILDTFPLMVNQKVDREKLPTVKIQLKNTVEYRAPASDLEVQVAAIWQKYLNLERVGRNDDFFDLGGNSLRAVALLDEISSATGVAVSLSQLFTCRTLSGLCNNMLEGGAKPAPVAILLNSNANLDPIFFVCGIQLYQELAFRISEEYSAYGIFLPEETASYQSDADNDEFEKFLDVKEYASRYIEAIRAQQPQGPYRVAGVSFGGILAYEIARQLKALGEQVESVYLFDSILPSGKQYSVSRRLKNSIKSVRDDAYERIQNKWKRLTLSRTKKNTSSHMQACAVSADLNESRLRDVRDRNYWKAMCDYDRHVRAYDGQVTLFTAEEREDIGADMIDKMLGWGRHVDGQIIAHSVSGGHLSMIFEPAVSEVAELLLKNKKANTEKLISDIA